MPTGHRQRFSESSFRRHPWFTALVKAMLQAKTQADMVTFLRDIGTLPELQAGSERLEVAKLLKQGKTYRDVAKMTGASTTTVTRVAKFLRDGRGYKRVLKGTKAKKKK